jgi:hypothetical protein
MAKIQLISTWYKGETHQANVFSLYSTGDNLIDSATFKYQLIEEIIIPEHEEIIDGVIVIIPLQIYSQSLITAEIGINGADYAQWNAEVDANAWIYQWAADQLNLVLIP